MPVHWTQTVEQSSRKESLPIICYWLIASYFIKCKGFQRSRCQEWLLACSARYGNQFTDYFWNPVGQIPLDTYVIWELPCTWRIPASPEQCPRKNNRGLPIFDDILIYSVGATRAEATEDYNRRLIALLGRCRSRGIKLSSGQVKTTSAWSTLYGRCHIRRRIATRPI